MKELYGYSPHFRQLKKGLLSVTSESKCMEYWLVAASSFPM